MPSLKTVKRLAFGLLVGAVVVAGPKRLLADLECGAGCVCDGPVGGRYGYGWTEDCYLVQDCESVMDCGDIGLNCDVWCQNQGLGDSSGTYCDPAICYAECDCSGDRVD